MTSIEKIKQAPAAISLCGWLLFYAGLFSVVGLFLLAAVADDMTQDQQLSSRFGLAMRAGFVFAGLTSMMVYAWALRRWFEHFLQNARRYGLLDVAMTAALGLALGALVCFGVGS